MTPEEFADIITSKCILNEAKGMERVLLDPPGRAPHPELIKLSRWYRAQSDSDKELIKQLMTMSSKGAIFGLFCALDGVSRIDDGDEPGELELWYTRHNQRHLLNPQSGPMLHDLLPNDFED